MTLLFVAGSHTDVGKTHVACALLHAARQAGHEVDAFKPVLSGFDAQRPEASDAGRLLEALDRQPTDANFDAVAPLRFEAPVAPPLAARRHGVRLSREGLVRLCNGWIARSPGNLGLLEGAGGVMSPIADDATNLDVIDDLGLPVLLVGGAYLGAVSHTLTALEVLRARGAMVVALVVSACGDEEAPVFSETVELTRRFVGATPIVAASRTGSRRWARELLEILPSDRPSRRSPSGGRPRGAA
jgi:dethiobiotin synthetase